MGRNGRDHHNYKHGLFTGYKDYRYGTDAKAVSVAQRRDLLRAGQRQNLTDKVFDIVRDWRLSPFEHEGACRAGLRESFCLDGNSWRESDREAREIVETAIKRLGFQRPTIEEGQPDWPLGTDYCSWCYGLIDEDGSTRKRKFCSSECATMAIKARDWAETARENAVLRSARRLLAKEKAPPRPCTYCGTMFRHVKEYARFCSETCTRRFCAGDRLIKDIVCEGCGKTCKPANRGGKFCSHSCAMATKWNEERARLAAIIRECQICHSDFTPTSDRSKYCSDRCNGIAGNRAYFERNRKPRTVHHFTCTCCGEGFATVTTLGKYCSRACANTVNTWTAQSAKRLTPRIFDYMLRRTGARVTDDYREAA